MTGTARRKLNSAAAAGPRPPHSPAHTVEPERETPRNTAANACAKPIPTATPAVGSARAPARRRVDQFMNPVTMKPAPTSSSEAAASRSEVHTSELQSQSNLVCRLLLE